MTTVDTTETVTETVALYSPQGVNEALVTLPCTEKTHRILAFRSGLYVMDSDQTTPEGDPGFGFLRYRRVIPRTVRPSEETMVRQTANP